MLDQNELNLLSGEDDEVLYEMIHSQTASERSAAIHILGERHRSELRFVTAVLERLRKEKSLYTRLEICSALEQGNVEAARRIVKYLGAIGNNQHKTLPDRVSRKISYPLPRDIIARVLSKMSPEVFDALTEVLGQEDAGMIAEALDAIGSMVFYNQQLATPEHVQPIYDAMEKYRDHQVVLWKSVMCLSAFPLESSVRALEEIKAVCPGTVISDEADRSLRLINSRIGKIAAKNS
jgi:hypothetical protein